MCRALLYLGQPVLLDHLLFQPDSALIRQSYMPKMLHMLNLAGFGMCAWSRDSLNAAKPFSYAVTTLPVFDRNLKNLAEKVQAECLLAHVRGVAYNTSVEISLQNVHPFRFDGVPLVLAHNGDLARMAEMKSLLARQIRPAYLPQIRGTTDSEWIYALFLSQFAGDMAATRRFESDEVVAAVRQTLHVLREIRAALGIATSSSVNLFIANGHQIAAVRYCFDFGCYPTEDPSRVHEANLNYLSLWYTVGRTYGLHDGEWGMQGGSNGDSVIIASEPLTRDTSAWVEVPEYGMIVADSSSGHTRLQTWLLD
ncbi:MAG: class II glutamine amidotransferase [Rhodoferax sp.]|nr:class II glutamine amidotransferase [Rhodoferax sp.]